MRKVSKEDWKEYIFPFKTNSILATIADHQCFDYHLFWVALLYKKYRIGDWNNKLPDPTSIPDKEYLLWDNEGYCLFHRTHNKFGKHIIECADPLSKNSFTFFDFCSLKPAFETLNSDNMADQLSHTATYYAHPEDRYDYKTKSHLWVI